MRRVKAILPVALAFWMAGCAANSKSKNTAVLPPTPTNKPVREPLSIPQTQVELPPLQPWNPEALASPAPPEPAAPATTPAPAPKPARRTPASPPPKPDAAVPAAPPAQAARGPIQEIVPADERKRFQESADVRKRETRQLLEQAKTRHLTAAQNKVVERIQTFLTQSDDAAKRGDMRQADALAQRGLVLAKGLAGGQ